MQNGQHRGDLGLVLFWECAGGCFFCAGYAVGLRSENGKIGRGFCLEGSPLLAWVSLW